MRADLKSLQNTFAQALVDINFLAPALTTFKGNHELNQERFALYRGNVSAIWQQSCVNAYPVLQQLVGADFFDDLARAYGRHHPSQSGNLTEFGSNMPSFLGTLESCRSYPYLSDIAALEWLVHRAYYLKHHTPLTVEELASVPPDQLSNVQCELQPCCALFDSPWAISDIWLAHQSTNPIFPDQISRRSHCLIWRLSWRSSWKVKVSQLSAGSYAALQALQAGHMLGAALDKALTVDPEFAVQTELADWFQKQLIISITLGRVNN